VICGIDVGGSALRLAVADRWKGATVVRSLVTHAWDPDRTLAAQVTDALRTCAIPLHEIHLAVSGDWATYRVLTFPFRSGRALDAAVPPALTTLLPFAPDDGLVAHEAIGRSGADGTLVCAAFGRRAEITALIDSLATTGCPVDSVLPAPLPALRVVTAALRDEPEVVFLDTAPIAPTLALLRSGSLSMLRVLRRPTDRAPTLDPRSIVDEVRWTIAAAASTPRPPVVVGGTAEMTHAISALLSTRLNLPVRSLADLPIAEVPRHLRPGQGEYAVALGLALGALGTRATGHGFEAAGSSPRAFEVRAFRREIRRTRAIAAVVLGLFIAYAALDWATARLRLGHAERMIRAGLTAVSRPDDAVGSVEELRRRVSVLEGGCGASAGCPGPLELLERLSGAIPQSLDVVIESIEIDGRTVLVEGRAADFAVVTQLRDALAPLGDVVAPSAAEMTSGGAGMTFRLQVSMAVGTAPPQHPTAPDTAKAVDA